MISGDTDGWTVAGRTFRSRLIVGTGKYKDFAQNAAALEASGAEIVTVAVRRVNVSDPNAPMLTDFIDPKRYTYLPNTAGCFDADSAVRTLRLAREAGGWDLVKLEVLGEARTLYPDMRETLKATAQLVREGFKPMVYCVDDPIAAKQLEEEGAVAIMPLGAPIGSGLGIQNQVTIRLIVEGRERARAGRRRRRHRVGRGGRDGTRLRRRADEHRDRRSEGSHHDGVSHARGRRGRPPRLPRRAHGPAPLCRPVEPAGRADLTHLRRCRIQPDPPMWARNLGEAHGGLEQRSRAACASRKGQVAMADGSVLLVEIAAGRITRVRPDGTAETVAEPGGGPNGLAIGPDGKLYCCNNGGFNWREQGGYLTPHGQADDYSGGRIERIDLATGAVETLYRDGDFGCTLRGPNDIVFDGQGGFWFTDHGKNRPRERDVTGIFYAKADGSLLKEVIFPVGEPERHRPLAGRASALCRRDLYLPVDGLQRGRAWPSRRHGGAGRPRHPALPAGGLQVLRFARGRGGRQHLRRNHRRVRHQRDLAGGRVGRVRAHRRYLHHEHLLGRRGYAGRLRHLLGVRAAGKGALAPAGAAAGLLTAAQRPLYAAWS
jgi:hypothetical protein